MPGGERFRALLGSYLRISKQFTTGEFLKNLALLPVDVVVDAFIKPAVINRAIKGIKNIRNVRKVATNLSKVFKESKSTREATQKLVGGIEKILPKVNTFEQARNKALELVGDLGPNSVPYIGRLGVGKGKIVGRESACGKVRWRLDYDPQKGPHINVEDFRTGKGLNARKIVIPFDGNLGAIESLLKHLNR